MIPFRPWHFGKSEIVVLAILAGLVLLIIGINTIPPVAHSYERVNMAWTSWAIRYGYFGAFLAALLGNLTIVIVFPYTIVIFFLAASGLNPIFLGVLTGLGAWLGELSGYILGRWGSSSFQKSQPEEFSALQTIVRRRPRFIHTLLFLFSALPLPDDVLFIPLGVLRYSLWKLFWPSVIGKTVAGLAIAYSGQVASSRVGSQSVASPLSVANEVGALLAITLVMYAMWRIDWTALQRRLLHESSS